MKKILGISAFYHDSAAAIVVGGKVMAAAQEERFTRQKHTAAFPVEAIRYCLEETGLTIDELDAVVFYDKPFLKFERLLETFYAFSPKGIRSFLKAMPVWTKEKLFLRKQLISGLKEVAPFDKKRMKLLYSEHHLSHAASAFFPSNYDKAAVLTIDGVGEWSTASIGIGEGNKITLLKEMHFPHSVGLLYSAFTYYLGFTVNSGEYKLMGLAPYGNPDDEQTKTFARQITTELIDIKEDGSIWMNQGYFNYAVGLRMANDSMWEVLFGIPRRSESEEILQHHCNLALAIQQVTEEIILKMVREAKRITNCDQLCLAGGVALNCVANGKILQEAIFADVYIQPASGDAGGALGAALAISQLYFGEARVLDPTAFDLMNGAYLGPEFSNRAVELMNRKVKACAENIPNYDELCTKTARLIADGNIVGWFQGRMEFGPRALGNRSILGDVRNHQMQQKINLKIKYREGFRPFAPSVLAEDSMNYFDLNVPSPYMLLVAPVTEARRKQLPNDFYSLGLKKRLEIERSDIQAVTHLDFSARVQTVHEATNPRYYQLISAIKKETNYGLVLNTSFNVRGEPVVCTPYDAYRCFMSTDMDYLVINDFLYSKTEQPDWQNKEKWLQHFQPD